MKVPSTLYQDNNEEIVMGIAKKFPEKDGTPLPLLNRPLRGTDDYSRKEES